MILPIWLLCWILDICNAIWLQAFEMQGNHTEALLELSKICLVHLIFPPEESSVCNLFLAFFLKLPFKMIVMAMFFLILFRTAISWDFLDDC